MTPRPCLLRALDFYFHLCTSHITHPRGTHLYSPQIILFLKTLFNCPNRLVTNSNYGPTNGNIQFICFLVALHSSLSATKLLSQKSNLGTTMWMYSIVLNCNLKVIKMVNFMSLIFYHDKKRFKNQMYHMLGKLFSDSHYYNFIIANNILQILVAIYLPKFLCSPCFWSSHSLLNILGRCRHWHFCVYLYNGAYHLTL